MATMTERLAVQLELLHRRDGELLQENRRLAQYAAEKQTLTDRAAAVAEEREKLLELRQSLGDRRAELDAQEQSLVAQREALRAEMGAEVDSTVDAVNKRVEEENSLTVEAVSLNSKLKEKIALLEENLGTGGEKFDELLATREQEAATMRGRLEELRGVNAGLQERLDAAERSVAADAPEHDALRAETAKHVGEFQEVQRCLTEANEHFTKSRAEQDGLAKRIRAAEADRAGGLGRLEKAVAARDAEAVAVAKQQQRVEGLEQQVARLTALIDSLRS